MDELETVEQQSGKRLFPIFQYRFGHGIQKLHHLIAAGLAGSPLIATAETHWLRGEAYYSRGMWRSTWDGAAGGSFATHAIHIHDLLCLVLGDPTSVFAQASNCVNGYETEDLGVVLMNFSNGAMASSSVTLGSTEQMSRLRFCFAGLTAEGEEIPTIPGMNPGLSRMMIQINKLGLTTNLRTFSPGLKDSLVSFFASMKLLPAMDKLLSAWQMPADPSNYSQQLTGL